MKNHKTRYDKEDENSWWGDNDWPPKEKRRRKLRWERNRRDKFSSRHDQDSSF
ncbi:MAG: hypothetical protein PVH84_06000 [Candidatus Aminicenantes bacterium]